jgi:uncharacterized protein
VPTLRARVTDLADVLPPADEARLEATLADFERETSHQIAVLVVPSLGGEPIEPFALRVAERAQLGQRGVDNGILLVIAVQDRRARAEVGYGLEGAVPDAVAKRVVDDEIAPRMRAGDPVGAVEAGVAALMRAARGEVVPAAARPSGRGGGGQGADPLTVVLFTAVAGSLLSFPLRARRRRPLAGAVSAAASGGLAWWLLASLGWAGLAALVGLLLGAVSPQAGGLGRRGGFRGSGGFGGGFGGGGGGGFGGGGGGGFSGGGGGFGGGGASGSW